MPRLIFSDKAGVFVLVDNSTLFAKAHPELAVVTWPDEIDLARS